MFLAVCTARQRQSAEQTTTGIVHLRVDGGFSSVRNAFPARLNRKNAFSADEWKIEASALSMNKAELLGKGAFCVVYKGYLLGEAPVLKMPIVKDHSASPASLVNCDVAVKVKSENVFKVIANADGRCQRPIRPDGPLERDRIHDGLFFFSTTCIAPFPVNRLPPAFGVDVGLCACR